MLGILNSYLIGWYFRKKFQISDKDTFPQIMIRDIQQFPIAVLDKSEQVEIDDKVGRVLSLYRQIVQTNLTHEKTILKRQIEATDKQIDQLVYKLYDLTEEEIKIVESET